MAETVTIRVPDDMREKVKVGSKFLSVRGNPERAEVGTFEITILEGEWGIATLIRLREFPEEEN